MTRSAALLGTVVLLACSNQTPLPCAAAPACSVVDEGASEGDVRVLWADGQDAVLSLEAAPTDVAVAAGEVVFTPDPADPGCEERCTITLKRLAITLRDVFFVSREDSLEVEALTVAYHAPVALENRDGTGFVLAAGSKATVCATVEGVLSVHEATLPEDGRLIAEPLTDELRFEASLPFSLDGSTALGCQRFDLELRGLLSGAAPFEQNPVRSSER